MPDDLTGDEPNPNPTPTPTPTPWADTDAAAHGEAAPAPVAEPAAPGEAEPAPLAGPVADDDRFVTYALPVTPVEVVEVIEVRPDSGGGAAAEAVRDLGARIDRRLDAIQTLIAREARAEATREKVVDRLHAELQEYKQDLLLNTLRPVFIDLIQLHDDIGKVAVDPPEGGGEASRLVGLMRGFQQGIEDILYRQGVEPFHVEGDAFDPRRQRAVGTVAADDPALNKTVAARLRKGFRSGDRVIRPEVVSVYAFKPA